jgi:hypothetical protein
MTLLNWGLSRNEGKKQSDSDTPTKGLWKEADCLPLTMLKIIVELYSSLDDTI